MILTSNVNGPLQFLQRALGPAGSNVRYTSWHLSHFKNVDDNGMYALFVKSKCAFNRQPN